jgi:hypothetical protein
VSRFAGQQPAGRLRTQYAGTRPHELDSLVDGGRTDRIPSAISALDSALAAAQRSVGATSGQRSTALDGRLRGLRAGQTAELTSLVRRLPSITPTAARVKIEGGRCSGRLPATAERPPGDAAGLWTARGSPRRHSLCWSLAPTRAQRR